jgi:hypothetical protein
MLWRQEAEAALKGSPGWLEEPGDLGQVVELFGSHVGLVELHCQLAVLPMVTGALPARCIQGVQQPGSDVERAEPGADRQLFDAGCAG